MTRGGPYRPDAGEPGTGWHAKVHEIIYEADTPAGKLFDIVLLVLIVVSILAVMFESVERIASQYGRFFYLLEWGITIVFTIEYVLRIVSVKKPWGYILSFYGIVDLLAILPTYLSLFVPGAESLAVIRALRIMRVFRVLKLGHYMDAAGLLRRSLWASRHKVGVFLMMVMTSVLVVSAAMYLIEGPQNGFTSIPRSLYWTIVTLKTVGYGDITPQTVLGQTVAAFVMLLGYSIIAVPTGIVTAEITEQRRRLISTQACPSCSREGHEPDAVHCKFCGIEL